MRAPGTRSARQWPSLSERISRCRIAAARIRQAAAGSASVPKTAISSGASARRSVWYAVNPASPEPTTATAAIYFTEPASSPWTK